MVSKRFAHCFKSVSIEPVVFIVYLSTFICSYCVQVLVLQKVCYQNEPPPVTVGQCDDVKSIRFATDMSTLRGVLRECLSVVAVVLGGAWRDSTGQLRILAVVALLGEILATCVSLVGVVWWSLSLPLQITLEATIGGIVGAKNLLNIVGTCIISEQCTEATRTWRISCLLTAVLAGSCLATALSGFLLESLGFRNLFILVILMNFAALLLLFPFVKDSPTKLQKGQKWLKINLLKPILKPRTNNIVLWLMLVNCCIFTSNFTGEGNVLLYYLQKTFDMTVSEVGLYFSYKLTVLMISSVIITPFLVKYLHWSDFSVGILSSFMTVIASVCYAFVQTKFQLYLVPFLDLSRFCTVVVAKSVFTKCVKKEEMGVFMSIILICESLAPIAILPLYDLVFSRNMTSFPGAFFLLTAASTFIMLLSFSLAKYIYKNEPISEDSEDKK